MRQWFKGLELILLKQFPKGAKYNSKNRLQFIYKEASDICKIRKESLKVDNY